MQYKLSKDYKLLYHYIKNGVKIAAWITNHRLSDSRKTRDIVEVKFVNDKYIIGVRGIGFESFKQSEAVFIVDCEYYELEYIKPRPSV